MPIVVILFIFCQLFSHSCLLKNISIFQLAAFRLPETMGRFSQCHLLHRFRLLLCSNIHKPHEIIGLCSTIPNATHGYNSRLPPHIGAESFLNLIQHYGSASQALRASSSEIAQLAHNGKSRRPLA